MLMTRERSGGLTFAGWYTLMLSVAICLLFFILWLGASKIEAAQGVKNPGTGTLMLVSVLSGVFSLAGYGLLRLNKAGFIGSVLFHGAISLLSARSLYIWLCQGTYSYGGAAGILGAVCLGSIAIAGFLLTGGSRRQFFGADSWRIERGTDRIAGVIALLTCCVAVTPVYLRVKETDSHRQPDPEPAAGVSGPEEGTQDDSQADAPAMPMENSGGVSARHILIAVERGATEEAKQDARMRIERIRQDLLAGQDFSDLARKFSDCPSKQNGGMLGFFGPGSMVKPFEDAAFALNPGEISPIVETDFGFHVIQVLEKKPAVLSASIQPDDPQLRALVLQLSKGSAKEREDAARSIGALGVQAEPAIPSLIRALGDEDEMVLLQVRETLGDLGSASIGPIVRELEHLRKSPDNETRFELVMTLLLMSEHAGPALPVLREMAIHEKNVRQKAFLQGVIATIESGSDSFNETGNADDRRVREMAPDLRQSIAEARALASEVIKPKITLDMSAGKALLAATAGDGEKALSEAKRWLDGSEEQRLKAVVGLFCLGQENRPFAVPARTLLKHALSDKERYIRLLAAVAMTRLGDRSSDVEDLVRREYESADHDVDVMLALGAMAELELAVTNNAARIMLREQLMSADSRVASFASHVLFNSGEGERVASVWAAMLGDKNPEMRMNGATCLWRMGASASRYSLQLSEAWGSETNAEVRKVMQLAGLAIMDDRTPTITETKDEMPTR